MLLAAALAVALVDPWALLQPGFWLSFVAVGLLVASEPAHASAPRGAAGHAWRDRLWRAVRGGLRTQVVATVGLAPLTMLFFQQVSLVGFVANLVAIPLVTLLITPLALLGVLLPPLWGLAGALVQGLTAVLQVLAVVAAGGVDGRGRAALGGGGRPAGRCARGAAAALAAARAGACR